PVSDHHPSRAARGPALLRVGSQRALGARRLRLGCRWAALGPAGAPTRLGPVSDSYYRALGEGRYEPTIHAQGAWREDEQHMGAPSGLIAHCIERHEPRPDMMLSRISYDILGVIDLAETRVHVETVRPGRTIELVEATLSTGASERPVIRARAWRLQTSDTSAVAGGAADPLVGHEDPGALPAWRESSEVWPGGFIAALDIRRPVPVRPGRGAVWQRTAYPLVD